MRRLSAAVLLLPLALNAVHLLQQAYRPWLALAILGVSVVAVLAVRAEHRPSRAASAVVPAAVGLLVLLVYVRTLSPTTDVADSLEFQSVVERLGLAHPPGYPLYVMLGKVFSWLPVGSFAWRMNFFSACAAVLTVVIVYLIGLRLVGRPVAAAAGALALGFARDFWSLALITEVYALNALLVAGTLYALVRWRDGVREDAGPRLRWLALAVACFAFGTLHHLTIVFVAPVLVGVVLTSTPRTALRPRNLAVLAAVCAVALTPVLYFPWRWPKIAGRAVSPGEVLAYVTASGYGGLFDPTWPLRDPSRLLMLGHELLAQFGAIGWLAAAIGLVALARSRRSWAVWLTVLFLPYVVFRLGYNAWDGWVILQPAHLVTALLIGAGIAVPLRWIAGSDRIARWRDLAFALCGTLAFLLPVALLWDHGPRVDRSRGWAGMAVGRDVLARALPPFSVVGIEPQLASALLYPSLFDHVRTDISVALPDNAPGRAAIDDPASTGLPTFVVGLVPDTTKGYHLRSLGPSIELGSAPLRTLPPSGTRLDSAPPSSWSGPDLVAYELTAVTPDEVVPLPSTGLAAGDRLGVTLYWHAPATATVDLAVALRVVDPDGLPVASVAGRPVGGYRPTTAWEPGEIVPDYHVLPIGVTAPPGTYRLEVAWADGTAAGARAFPGASPTSDTAWRMIAPVPVGTVRPSVAGGAGLPLNVDWDGRVRLLGVDGPRIVRPGDLVDVTLYWRRSASAAGTPDAPGAEAQGFAATVRSDSEAVTVPLPDDAAWPPGSIVASRHRIRVPEDASPGRLPLDVELVVGGEGLRPRDVRHPVARAPTYPLRGVRVRTDLTGLDRPVTFADGVRLISLATDRIVHPAERTWVRLAFEAWTVPTRRYKVSVQLLDASQERRANVDRQVLHGTVPTEQWRQGDLLADAFALDVPDDLAPGGHLLQVSVYDADTGVPLAVLDDAGHPVDDRVLFGIAVVPDPLPALPEAVDVVWGDQLRLRGYAVAPLPARSGGDLTVTLRLAAMRPPDRDYTLFAHLLPAGGDDLLDQHDGQPFDGVFPTTDWPVGEPLDVPVALHVPDDLAAGDYRVALGWYDLATGVRLPVDSGPAGEAADRFIVDVAVR